MKIVIGAAGFVGFHLVNSLLDQGQDVVAYDNFDTTLYPLGPKLLRAAKLAERGIEIQRTEDVCDMTAISSVQEEDVIFNLAATAGLTKSWSKPTTYYSNNTLLVAELLEAIAARKVTPTIIHASTSSVYGQLASGKPGQALKPSSPYGLSKLAAEELLGLYSRTHNIKVRILRLFSVYGPHQRPDQLFSVVLNKLQNNEVITIFGDGNKSRSNVFVTDAVNAFLLAQNSTAQFIAIDVAGNETKTALEVVIELSRRLGIEARLEYQVGRPGDQTATVGNLEEAFKMVGWRPLVNFQNGVSQLVDHYTLFPKFYELTGG